MVCWWSGVGHGVLSNVSGTNTVDNVTSLACAQVACAARTRGRAAADCFSDRGAPHSFISINERIAPKHVAEKITETLWIDNYVALSINKYLFCGIDHIGLGFCN